MIRIEIIKADLWGNVKEGFDNNEEYRIGEEELSRPPGDKKLSMIAKDYFEGRYLARTENRSLPMRRDDIRIEYLNKYNNQTTYKIMHNPTGTYLGRIQIVSQ